MTVQILADAYGYGVTLPSTFDTAHVTPDSLDGTLLVQGGVTSQGWGQNDTINISVDGTNLVVQVNSTTERVPIADVSQVLIAQNGGIDTPSISVPASIPWRYVHYVVSSNQDAIDLDGVGNLLADSNWTVPGRQTTLRAAIQDSNLFSHSSVPIEWIYAPRATHQLTISGSGGDHQGDFDIGSKVTILGAGAGETIIDASPLRSTSSNRIFDVQFGARLDLHGVTLTGGRAPAGAGVKELHGGAVFVRNGGTFILEHSAIVGNQAGQPGARGGAVYFENYSGGYLLNSVITANHAGGEAGGVYLEGQAPPPSNVFVGNSIIVNNLDGNHSTAFDDVYAGMERTFISQGNNRLGNAANGFTHNVNGDYIRPAGTTVHYVVTGLTDTFNSANDATVLSVREAVNAANIAAGAEEIWLPAWNFTLTRDRSLAPTDVTTDMTAEYGDLDVRQSLTIRGVNGSTSVAWRAGAAFDAVFELVGDYNKDGVTDESPSDVDSADYIMWRKQLGQTGSNLAADGDDDGDVDQADYNVWSAHFGNTLMLLGIS